jgi:hypothetical protein
MKKSVPTIGLTLLIMTSLQADQVYQSQPSDDVWAYDNAFNAGLSPLLRSWGDGIHAVDPTGAPPALNYSYSYAKWNLGNIRQGVQYRILEAYLTVIQTTSPGYSQILAQSHPLEARNLGTNFNELTWNYDDPDNPYPGSQVFGTGSVEGYRIDDVFPIPIDLLGGSADFAAYFNESLNRNRQLAIALVSSMDPGGQGGQAFYRYYSRNDAGGRGPVLFIRYAVSGDVNGDGCVDDSDLLSVLFAFGQTGQSLPADLNGDGVVDDSDLLQVLFHFGNGC